MTRITHVNGWFPAACLNYTSQNFRSFPYRIYPFKIYVVFCTCNRGAGLEKSATACQRCVRSGGVAWQTWGQTADVRGWGEEGRGRHEPRVIQTPTGNVGHDERNDSPSCGLAGGNRRSRRRVPREGRKEARGPGEKVTEGDSGTEVGQAGIYEKSKCAL